MDQVETGIRVVVAGGTVPASMVQLVGELSRTPGLTIIASCPSLEAEQLQAACAMPVILVEERVELQPDRVYLLPRDRLVLIEDGALAPGLSERAPLDCIFRSAATQFGGAVAGVALAGVGTDGPLGLKRLKEEGGLTVAQQVEGRDGELPLAAIETGLVDLVLPLGKIASRIRRFIEGGAATIAAAEERRELDADDDALREILAYVRVRSGHDFTSYKRATLSRRIARRIQVCECSTVESYHRYLRDHPNELAHLLRDFLISVTNFFRDGDAFANLAQSVIPRLFAGKRGGEQLRIWVAGCATGEEAYSFGMLLLEHAATMHAPPPMQIFATDIDEHALAEARQGCYSDAIMVDVSRERLGRFFARENGQFRVVKELRELVLFSPHNVLRDPPFSRLDLVSCRNLLIYLNRDAQQRVLTIFHFGLRPEGTLFLGSSESAEGSPTFAPLDPRNRLFVRKPVVATLGDVLPPPPRWQPALPAPAFSPRERSSSLGELHHRVVEHYAPPSVLIDAELDVLHVSERAGRYLQVGGGEPTRQILRMIHPSLRLELRSAIYAARQSNADRRLIRFEATGAPITVDLRVRVAEAPEFGHGTMLITFDDIPADAAQASTQGTSLEPVVREIEDELHRTRDQLRDTIEQYETSLEELKASNEELQAINEELRSATEELETSKEELQSVNEELTTVNHELKFKVEEVSHANSDLQNLMTSTEIGVIFLDRGLNIKRFTPRVAELFNIIASDIGRPLGHLTHRLNFDGLVDVAHTVLQTLRVVEHRIPTRDGRAFLVRWLPYRSVDDRIDGIVLTFIDVTDLRDAVEARSRSESALRLAEERLGAALAGAPLAVLTFARSGELIWAHVLGSEQRGPLQLADGDRDALADAVKASLESGRTQHLELAFAGRAFDFRVEAGPNGITAVGFDVTANRAAAASLRDADVRKDEFLATLAHELRNPLAPLKVALEIARLVGNDAVQRSESLGVMERQVGMLTELVDELLDLSRLTHDKVLLERQVIDIADVIERSLEAVRPAATTARHVLEVQLPSTPGAVFGDRRRLVQVFVNVLTNAIKYTPPGGRIELAVEVTAEQVAVRIADSGIGIAPDLLPHVFEIFVQSRDDRGRSQGGLGIGLNVVRRLVELHGGTASVASAGLGRGSAFTITLPRYRP